MSAHAMALRDALPAAPAFDAWRLPLWSAEQWRARGGTRGLSEHQLRYLASFGVLAPTTHNTVPQRFGLLTDQQALGLHLDRSLVLPESDPKGRQALVSLGCVVTNIEIAARVFGYGIELELAPLAAGDVTPLPVGSEPQGERFVTVGKLAFSRTDDALPHDWLRTLTEHKVVRAEYDASAALPRALLDAVPRIVRDSAPEAGVVEAHVLTGALALRGLGKFQEQADRFVIENPRFAQELGRWLLPNSDVRTARAMRGVEFGFDDAFAEQVHSGLLGKRRLLPDQIATFAKGGKVGLESSSAVIVLTTDGDGAMHRVAAGRAGHRISLEMQRAGFASAYHAALTEVEWVARMFSRTLLRTARRPMALLRVGRPKRASDGQRPPAARPSLEQLLLP